MVSNHVHIIYWNTSVKADSSFDMSSGKLSDNFILACKQIRVGVDVIEKRCKFYSQLDCSVSDLVFVLKGVRLPRWHSGLGAVLQIGRSLVRSQMVSLEFFIDIILPIALWPWGRLSL